MLIESL